MHDGHTHAAYHTLTKQKRTRSTDPLSCLLPITLSSKQAGSARLAVVESQNRIGRLSPNASPNHEAARLRAASAAGRRGVCTAAPAAPVISSTATTRDEVGPSSYSCCVPVAVFDPTLRIAFHSHVLHTHIRAHHTHGRRGAKGSDDEGGGGGGGGIVDKLFGLFFGACPND